MSSKSTKYEVKRLDHLGIVAGVIKDLKIIEMIDERLGKYEGETLTAGEAVAGMIINGLGFSGKPMSLTPLFFENCPVELLFGEGVDAADFNRFKLGRVLDRCYNYGTELLFSEIALNVCRQENVDTRFNSEDTTSFVVYGNYVINESNQTSVDESNQTAVDESNQTAVDESNQTVTDESNQTETGEAMIEVKRGYSKANRPDLKQVMLEMMVSQDGGIPLMGKCFRSHASDNVVFKERSEKLIEQFQESETPRYLIADSKLYTEKNAVNLKDLRFITRIPNQLKLVEETIDKALAAPNDWQTLDEGRVMQTFDIEHYGIKQRWHVLSSKTSQQRGAKQVEKQVTKEAKTIEKELFHLQAKRFNSADKAIASANTLEKKWKFHNLKECTLVEHKVYTNKGRPKKRQKPDKIQYQVVATSTSNEEKINQNKAKQGHYIVGGNAQTLSDEEVVDAYKKQHHVERGFRFLKDPLFFASSLFVKSTRRIMGLMMIMLLSLLVYGIAEKRMRACLKQQGQTLPNQIQQEIPNPTLLKFFSYYKALII